MPFTEKFLQTLSVAFPSIMKKTSPYPAVLLKLSLLIIFLSNYSVAFAQLIPISLNQRIDNSSQIFEGEVISKLSYWNEDKSHIYTINVVNIYKVFKGISTQKSCIYQLIQHFKI